MFLIPRFSYIGAAVATICTEGLGLILMGSYINKKIFKVRVLRLTEKPLFIGVVTAISLYLLRKQLNWLLAAGFGCVIYLLLVGYEYREHGRKVVKYLLSF